MKIILFPYTFTSLFYYIIFMPRKNTTAKIAAIIALIAIIWSIVSTWALVIYESYFWSPNSETSLTQEQLQELLQSFSWTTSASGVTQEIWSGELLNEDASSVATWSINETNQ